MPFGRQRTEQAPLATYRRACGETVRLRANAGIRLGGVAGCRVRLRSTQVELEYYAIEAAAYDVLRIAARSVGFACKLPEVLTWYQCTRPTFASQWIMDNGSMEKLATVLGHSSTEVRRRLPARVRPGIFRCQFTTFGALAQW